MSNLELFQFEGKKVRSVGTPEKPELIAQDVGDVLGIKNVRQNLAEFDDDEKGVCSIYTPGGNQELLTVTEPGLYRLILASRKPQAKAFRRWVFHEVLPSIRKTGGYSTQPSAFSPHPSENPFLHPDIQHLHNLLIHADLKRAEMLVLLLLYRSHSEGVVFPTLAAMATALGISRSTVSSVMNRLNELGLVEVQKQLSYRLPQHSALSNAFRN